LQVNEQEFALRRLAQAGVLILRFCFRKTGLRENRDFCFAFKLVCPVQTPCKK
jgi:hypothetical protein